jgi:chemosensory pili system protein ChpC
MAAEIPEVRTLLAPLGDESLLLPNSVVAEVITYTEPDPYDNTPPWLLGELGWNDWQVPLVNLAGLIGAGKRGSAIAGSHVLIVKTLSDTHSIMYLGILIGGLPKLRKLTPDDLETQAEDPGIKGIFARVKLGEQLALIPELGDLTGLVERALYAP